MNGQPSTYITITLNGRAMYRTDDVFGGTDEEAEVNARTFCAHCGAQPIEWHNPEHVELNRQNHRVSKMKNASLEAIRVEMARCTPLCRRCHMYEDGCLKKWADRREEESWGDDSAQQQLERGPR